MANEKQLEILKQGVKAWNAWRKENEEEVVDLSGVELRGAELRGANLMVANLKHTNLRDTDLRDANLSCADLEGTNLRDTDLHNANLSNADLRSAKLTNADLSFAKLISADLSGAKLISTKLIGVKLMNADLSSVNFSGAHLNGANLTAAYFSRANLSGADLDGADLRGANLGSANLYDANFHSANLGYTSLYNTTFNASNLTDTDLTSARISNATFANVDLSTVKGLAHVEHHGPSTIGIDTLYLSKGKIPEVFLRGCGVPESFIMQARALIGAEEGIEFYSCFISYSTRDEEFAQRLHGRLQQDGVRVWYSPHNIQGGRHLHEQIEDAIRSYDKLLILLSPDSMASSWVQTELRKARKLERRTGKRKLFPMRLVDYAVVKEWECPDGDSGEDLAVEVRKYFIPDFTRWKDHDAFEQAYARLLKDLKADEAAQV